MPTYSEVLNLAQQLTPDEQGRLLDALSTLINRPTKLRANEALNRRAFLKLPPEQRDTLLSEQVATIAAYFQPGMEDVEWAESFVEDEDWDDA